MHVERVMERVYDRRRRRQAWQTVQRNAGAAGIDQMTVDVFAEREDEFLDLIHDKLQAGTYRFKPARRVSIPKPGSTKKRHLGIPVVMDRVVSHSLHSMLEELFEPDFTASNCGFRRGKSQHQAIGHVRQAVVEGYEWCAAIDLQGFFDEIPHDLILKLIRRKIRDERVVALIARALRAGVMASLDWQSYCAQRGEAHPERCPTCGQLLVCTAIITRGGVPPPALCGEQAA